jgi:aspartate oxidase
MKAGQSTSAPRTARVRRGGEVLEVPAEELRHWDIVLVRAGEKIPVDGKVLSGESAVNQALSRSLELEGMVQLAEVVALGALAREESRGSHTRRDHPHRDDGRFLAHTVATMEKGEVTIGYKPVTLGMFKVEERGY